MVELKYTPVEEIENIHEKLYKTFKAGVCRPLGYRRKQLYAFARLAQENADAIAVALQADLGRDKEETIGFEVAAAVTSALEAANKLEEWAKPEIVEASDFHKTFSPTIQKTPKGPALLISPWNVPLMTIGFPLVAAIAAGNPAVIKPSEISANFAQLFSQLLPKYLDTNAYAIVNGAVKETSKLLELKWAHVHYTGNGRVARIIATAAAKHLTPVTLELGGKSPVIIDPSYDLDLAAKRILWGRTVNAGQGCICPDYVLIPKNKQAELIAAFKKHAANFWPNGALKSDQYPSIISAPHFARIKGLVDRTKGTVVIGGGSDERRLKIEPTIVADVTGEDSLMSEEIFGPVLPIVTVADVDEAIDFVTSREHPLHAYAFTDNAELKKKITEETISGALQFNDVVVMVPGLPFAGVGGAGYGYQCGKFGFDDFSHFRGTVDVPKEVEQYLGVRYPPFTAESKKIITAAAYQPIPA